MSREKVSLRRFWKPDGKSISKVNRDLLHHWMSHNGLSTRPGAITVFIHSPIHNAARNLALQVLKIPHK